MNIIYWTPLFLVNFWRFSHFWGIIFFLKKSSCHAQLHNLKNIKWSNSKKMLAKTGRMWQTLFYRTLLVIARGLTRTVDNDRNRKTIAIGFFLNFKYICAWIKICTNKSNIIFNFHRKCKVASGFRYGKKTFCQNSDKFGYSFVKNDVTFMYLLCIYKKVIILSLFKIYTLNFTMYILTVLTWLSKHISLDYVI